MPTQFALRQAQRTKTSDDTAPLHHREHGRVVNDEHAHHHRKEREGLEVELKGPRHLRQRSGAIRRGLEDGQRPNRTGEAERIRGRFNQNVDAREPVTRAEHLLGGRNIHHEPPAKRLCRAVGYLQGVDHDVMRNPTPKNPQGIGLRLCLLLRTRWGACLRRGCRHARS